MRVLDRYLLRTFLVTFALTLAVFTFVMCLGAVVKAIDLLARGVSGWFILKVFFYNIPFLLSFSIPMSVLTAVLLMFGRLSSDNEINAMKASGLSLWQIATPVILASVVLTFVCLVINGSIAPASHWAQRRVLVELGVTDPLSLLEEGRFTRDIPGYLIYVGKKEHAQATDVHIYELGEQGVKHSIRAKSGRFVVDKEHRKMLVTLFDARGEEPDPLNPSNLTQMKNASGQIFEYPPIDLDGIMQRGTVNKKGADMTYGEVLDAIRDVRRAYPGVKPEDLDVMRMKMVVDANQRLALALSCFAFTLLAIPLGMKSHRKETSIGFGLSILLVFFFYFFIIIADSLVRQPQFRPDLIIWIPVLACELIGFLLLKRMA